MYILYDEYRTINNKILLSLYRIEVIQAAIDCARNWSESKGHDLSEANDFSQNGFIPSKHKLFALNPDSTM